MKITTAFFSATNTTKHIVTAIAEGISSEVTHHNLLAKPLAQDLDIPANETLIVGMPVYAGRVPAVALASLQHLKGHHTPVILVAVYGNREFDDIFVEMQDVLEANGFFVGAASAFIAQHSIFPHTAKGRPDAKDEEKMKDFARLCQERLEKGFAPDAKSIALPGNRPYKTPGNIPLKMLTDASCVECGACSKACPVAAIPADNPKVTDYEKCIHCGHCMTVCSVHARHYGGLLFHVAGTVFGWKNRHRKEPQFFF